MKKIYSIKLFVVVCLLAFTALLSGCKKDENSPAVRLDSFGPSGVAHGEDITFIGTGLDQVTSVVMPVGVEVPASAFKTHTPTRIVFTVPQESTEGKVTLKTPQGDVVSKANFGASYTVAITSVTPSAKPGTNITITGEFLDYIKQVTFTQGKAVTTFVSQSLTELVVTVPIDAQSGKIVFSDMARSKPQVLEFEDFDVTMPTITGMAPLNIKHSDQLTVTGTDLDLVSEIDFPNGATVNSSAFVSQTVTQIVVAVPNTAKAGTITFKVPSTLQVVSGEQITIILPAAETFSTSTPGAEMTITGTDLDLVKSILFPDGGAGASVTSTEFSEQSPTQIKVTIPMSAVAGTLKFITIHDFQVAAAIPFGVQVNLSYTVFNEGFDNAWQYWGWGGAADAANDEQVKDGAVALKKTYDNAYEGCQIGAGSVALATYNTFNVSIFGGAGSDGKNVRLVINGGYGDGQYASLTLVEGQWTDFSVTFDQINNPTTITEIVMQSEFAGTIYIDKLGLK